VQWFYTIGQLFNKSKKIFRNKKFFLNIYLPAILPEMAPTKKPLLRVTA
jgi:hypothetical protein